MIMLKIRRRRGLTSARRIKDPKPSQGMHTIKAVAAKIAPSVAESHQDVFVAAPEARRRGADAGHPGFGIDPLKPGRLPESDIALLALLRRSGRARDLPGEINQKQRASRLHHLNRQRKREQDPAEFESR